jgi:hypothetical protein
VCCLPCYKQSEVGNIDACISEDRLSKRAASVRVLLVDEASSQRARTSFRKDKSLSEEGELLM